MSTGGRAGVGYGRSFMGGLSRHLATRHGDSRQCRLGIGLGETDACATAITNKHPAQAGRRPNRALRHRSIHAAVGAEHPQLDRGSSSAPRMFGLAVAGVELGMGGPRHKARGLP